MTTSAAAIDRQLDDAIRLQRAGSLAEAEAALRAVLETAPGNPEAWQLLGGLHLQAGEAEQALAALRKAEALAPDAALIQMSLSAALIRLGDPAAALDHAHKATRLAPDFADPWRNLAAIARRAGDLEAEAAALAKLAAAQPGEETLALRLADIETARRRWPQVVQAAQAFLAVHPDHEAMREKLSHAHLEIGDVPSALAAYRPLTERTPPVARHLLRYGRLCLIAQDFETARRHLETAAELEPDSAEAAFSLGRLHTFLGDLPRAEEACYEALRRDPQSVHALVQLTALKRGRIEDDLRTRMESLWAAAEAPPPMHATLGFALGDACDAAGDPDRAFAFYEAANRINYDYYALDLAHYDTAAEQRKFARLAATLAEPGPPPGARPPLGFRPIFVVGMPRSGTTLIESILAAHSAVHGAGEVLVGPKILEDFLLKQAARPDRPVDAIVEENASAWRRAYARAVGDHRGAAHVVDKMPHNFMAVGLFRRVFPEAAIVHVARDPLDTGLSIFQHSFPKAYAFTHRLEDIGHQYTLYREIMATWRAAFPGLLVEVGYEHLVDHQEAETRRLVEAVGLAWEDACLAFHATKRPIATFSSIQVRAPMSRGSIGKAERYRAHLGPLVEALEGDSPSPPVRGEGDAPPTPSSPAPATPPADRSA